MIPIQMIAGDINLPASNTAAVITKAAAGAGLSHVISGVAWSYDSAPTGGALTITDDGTTVFAISITAGGPGFIPFIPMRQGTANKALVATLAAGGSGVTGKLALLGWFTTPNAALTS